MNLQWSGEGVNEQLTDMDTKKTLLAVDPQFYRPGEVEYLRGTYKKINKELEWSPDNRW